MEQRVFSFLLKARWWWWGGGGGGGYAVSYRVSTDVTDIERNIYI